MNYNTTLNTAYNLLSDDKRKNIGMYIIVSLSTGLRVSETLTITWEQLRRNNVIINTKKVWFNNNVIRALNMIDGHTKNGPIFISQKKTVYSREHINRVLKDVYPNDNVTTHTLRKLFGLRYMELSKDKDSAITHLSNHLGHNSINITKTYLGLEDNIMDEYDVYRVVDNDEYTCFTNYSHPIEEINKYRDIIPSLTKGIYYLYDKNKTIVYIGKSIKCIRQRINTHYEQTPNKYLTNKDRETLLDRRETYKYFSYLPIEEIDKIDGMEVECIREHRPVYNKEFLYAI